ncbi:MAG TPA: hypothetical protein VF161_11960 [Steroidobacteraceae bacterium]|jgi:hypothetical protein
MHRPFVLFAALAAALISQASFAEEGRDELRLHFGKSSESDLVTVVVGDYQESPESNYLLGATWGHEFSDTLFGLPFPMSAHVGVQYFDERGYQDDGYGVTAFIKASYDLRVPFTQKYVRLGLGEGLSYVSRIPMSEQRDFAKKGVESEKLLNYVEWTVDLPLQQFDSMKHLLEGRFDEVSVGFVVWHRSSVFGLFAEEKGGVNFMGFGVNARF